MLQNAIETIPPTLNEVWSRMRNGPSVQSQMWNESQCRSFPTPCTRRHRFRTMYIATPPPIMSVPTMASRFPTSPVGRKSAS